MLPSFLGLFLLTSVFSSSAGWAIFEQVLAKNFDFLDILYLLVNVLTVSQLSSRHWLKTFLVHMYIFLSVPMRESAGLMFGALTTMLFSENSLLLLSLLHARFFYLSKDVF